MITLSLDGYEYPAKFEICADCGGVGYYGNVIPGDDDHTNVWDVTCDVCLGSGKILEVDFQKLTAEEEVRYNNYMLDLSESGLELRAEQQMGY